MSISSSTVRGPHAAHGRAVEAPHEARPESTAQGRLDLLEALVRALPFGVEVSTDDGTMVLDNPAARDLLSAKAGAGRAASNEDRVIEATDRRLDAMGTAYGLRLAVDVTEQRRIERELFDRAFLDELTGLPNRSLIQQSTDDLIAAAGPDTIFALAFVDLDNFKHINDYYSHAVGDALLARIGARLTRALRPSDTVARIGGDEFVLLVTPVVDTAALKDELDAIVERLKQPFFIDGHEIFASASMGVSLFPEHGRTYETLRGNADSAMYRIKTGTKGGAVLFDATMGHAASARMTLEQRLRLAIRDRRFCCAFQPKVDIRTQVVTGVEVLLRWRDEGGLIQAPGDFVGLAIELGLINDITHLVLDETMRTLAGIDDVFGAGVSISLNVAAKQADDLGFMRSLIDALAATGCSERFVLELTEEAFFVKNRFQKEILPRLRRIGTKVSIDDFGVGYSSLAALAEISVDEIKIDRSFITEIHRRPRSQCVLRAIESLSHGLGLSIVAEGVETFEELAYLQAATRIHQAQGYYFAKPMLLEDVVANRLAGDARSHGLARDPATLREDRGRSRGRA